MKLVPALTLLATGLAAGATGTYAVTSSIDAEIRVQTDSLRLEAQRKQGPRVTVVRRLAARIDSIAVAWKPDIVAVPDSTPADTVTPPDSTTSRDSTPVDTATPPDSTPLDSTPRVDTTKPDTTPVPPPPTFPLFRVAELPRTLPVVPFYVYSRPCTDSLATGLQAALGAARGGAVMCLTGTHRGNFTVPARSDSGWIVLRSAQACPAGRVRPSQYAGARIQSPNNFAALTFKARSQRVLVTCLEITSDSALALGPNPLVAIGQAVETTVADLPDEIALDRVWLHGWAHQQVRRGVAGNGQRMTLTRSWCEEIHDGNDSQCWITWNGAGPVLIEDNTLEAASENIMFGGGDPRVPGLVVADVTIRRNHIRKPVSWRAMKWNVKNLIESKASARVLVEENVLEGVWTEGQVGYAFVLKSTAQNSNCLPCGTSDWTIRRNRVDSAGAGFSFAGRADQRKAYTDTAGVFHKATGTTDSTVRRIDVVENWFGLLNRAPYVGDGRPFIFTSDNHDIAIRRNVFEGGGIREAILFNTTSTWPSPVWNLVVTDNVVPRGQYGVGMSNVGEGLRAWTGVCTASIPLVPPMTVVKADSLCRAGKSPSTFVWINNALIGKTTIAYPPGTTWFADLTSALASSQTVSRSVIDAGVRGVVVPR